MRASGAPILVPSSRVGRLGVVMTVAMLVAGCATTSPSGPPPASPSASPAASPPASIEPSSTPTRTPAGEGSWKPAGTTTFVWAEGKSGGTAVQLADGRVLVVGDPADADEPTAPSAELWDPATNAWTETTGLERQRWAFAMVGLADGRALVVGGLNDDWGATGAQSYSSAYTFEPERATWSKVGLMSVARTAPAATLLPDGRVLVVGGYFHTGFSEEAAAPPEDPSVALAAYRPEETEAPLQSLPPLQDVDIPPYGYALATAEIFDPATDTWAATGPMQYARVAPAVVAMADGRVLVLGSSDAFSVTDVHPDAFVTAEVYDPATGRFSPAGALPAIDRAAITELWVDLPEDDGAPGAIGTLVAQPDGDAVLVDNVRWWKHTAEIVRSVRLDIESMSWSVVGPPCASARDDAQDRWVYTDGCVQAFAFTVGLDDGRALGAGGYALPPPQEEWQPVADAQVLDPVSGAWTPTVPMPNARMGGIALGLRDGTVLLFGGIVEDEYGRAAVRFVPPR